MHLHIILATIDELAGLLKMARETAKSEELLNATKEAQNHLVKIREIFEEL